MSDNHSEHRRQFMYLSFDIFRRCTNVEALVVREYQRRKGNNAHPTNFALKKSIESYYDKLMQPDFDWEKSILKNLEFIYPNEGVKIDAAIWSLTRKDRTDVYEKATMRQKKFIYLPLNVFQKETNISQLVQAMLKEQKFSDVVIRAIMEGQVIKAHKNLTKVKSWPHWLLSGLKFLNEDSSNDDVSEASTKQGQSSTASTSGSQRQPLLNADLSRKRKESSSQKENDSVQDKKPKINVDGVNSKIPMRRTQQNDVQQVTKVGSGLACSNVDVKPVTSTVTLSQQVSNLNQSQTVQKRQRVPCEPSDFQREIIALSRDDFLEKTNVKELVSMDFERQFNGQREMTPAAMEWGLNEYDRLRQHYDKWHLNSLKNLKFKECECKRHKAFEDKATQTDDAEVKDAGTQYTPLDSNGNETTADLERRKLKLALLTINEISDLQINIQCDMPDSQYQDQNEREYVTDDVCTVNEAEVNNQQSQVAPGAETPKEGATEHSPEASEVAITQPSQTVELQSLEPLNCDQTDANTTDKACSVNETDKNDQPSQVASDADAETANSSSEAPEVALSQQSQLGANNDTFTDKEDIENCNLSQNVHIASATANGNGKGIQMTSVQNRAVQLKQKKPPRNHAFSTILREIGKHIESHKAPTLDLKRKVDLCIAMELRDSNKN